MIGRAIGLAAGPGLLFAACVGFVNASVYEDGNITASHTGFKFAGTGSGLQISGSDVAVAPKGDLCDVKIEAIPDDNGNGQPDDKGTTISSGTGSFTGWSSKNIQFGASASTSMGFIKISGWRCVDHKKVEPFTSVIVITGGRSLLVDADASVASLAWVGSGASPHFTELRRSAFGTKLVAGDLIAAPRHLRGALTGSGKAPGDDGFLGLAILAGEQLLGFFPAQSGVASVDLPALGRRVDLRLIGVDKRGRVVADWKMRNLEL